MESFELGAANFCFHVTWTNTNVLPSIPVRHVMHTVMVLTRKENTDLLNTLKRQGELCFPVKTYGTQRKKTHRIMAKACLRQIKKKMSQHPRRHLFHWKNNRRGSYFIHRDPSFERFNKKKTNKPKTSLAKFEISYLNKPQNFIKVGNSISKQTTYLFNKVGNLKSKKKTHTSFAKLEISYLSNPCCSRNWNKQTKKKVN